jgi:hypothetical protein
LLLAAILLGRFSPLAPHHAGAIRERLRELNDNELREMVATGKWPNEKVEAPKSAILWAWWSAEKREYRHLYPSELCVRMCSPDGYASDEAAGRGRVMQVNVTPNIGAG